MTRLDNTRGSRRCHHRRSCSYSISRVYFLYTGAHLSLSLSFSSSLSSRRVMRLVNLRLLSVTEDTYLPRGFLLLTDDSRARTGVFSASRAYVWMYVRLRGGGGGGRGWKPICPCVRKKLMLVEERERERWRSDRWIDRGGRVLSSWRCGEGWIGFGVQGLMVVTRVA